MNMKYFNGMTVPSQAITKKIAPIGEPPADKPSAIESRIGL